MKTGPRRCGVVVAKGKCWSWYGLKSWSSRVDMFAGSRADTLAHGHAPARAQAPVPSAAHCRDRESGHHAFSSWFYFDPCKSPSVCDCISFIAFANFLLVWVCYVDKAIHSIRGISDDLPHFSLKFDYLPHFSSKASDTRCDK
jgi:hypothetical protein